MSTETIRIISLNMLHGFPNFNTLSRRLDLLASEISRYEADIVLLQEVPWTYRTGNAAALLAQKTSMNYAFVRANGNRRAIMFEEGVAILSRFPMENLDFIELKPRAGIFEHRIVLHSSVSLQERKLDLYVTHLTNGDPAINLEQSNALRSYVEETSSGWAIVAGDFNAAETSVQISSLPENWIDSYRFLHSDEPGLTCCDKRMTEPSTGGLNKRIDYIFIVSIPDGRINVLKSDVILDQAYQLEDGWLRISDHAGLLIELDISGR